MGLPMRYRQLHRAIRKTNYTLITLRRIGLFASDLKYNLYVMHLFTLFIHLSNSILKFERIGNPPLYLCVLGGGRGFWWQK